MPPSRPSVGCPRSAPSNPIASLLIELRSYYVYIMASYRGTLYTGVTNDLVRRVQEHKDHRVEGFTAKYNVTKLVYCEETSDIRAAIAREKQIKGWRRSKKVALIESINPHWVDLLEES